MTEYRARQPVVALGLSGAVGLACGAWLVTKALAKISAGVRLPRGAR